MFGYRKLSEMKGVTGTYKEEHDRLTCAVSSSRAAVILKVLGFPGLTPIDSDRILRSDELIRQ